MRSGSTASRVNVAWTQILVTGNDADGAPVDFSFQTVQQVRDEEFARIDVFSDEMADEARACFEASNRPRSADHWAPENTAFRAGRESVQCVVDSDWNVELYHPDVRFEDRRSGVRHTAVGRDAVLDYSRASATMLRARAELTCWRRGGSRRRLAARAR